MAHTSVIERCFSATITHEKRAKLGGTTISLEKFVIRLHFHSRNRIYQSFIRFNNTIYGSARNELEKRNLRVTRVLARKKLIIHRNDRSDRETYVFVRMEINKSFTEFDSSGSNEHSSVF